MRSKFISKNIHRAKAECIAFLSKIVAKMKKNKVWKKVRKEVQM